MNPLKPSSRSVGWWQSSGQLESITVAAILIFASIAGRLLLDQPNFKPSMAAAILAGAILGNWRLALSVPLVSALVTDVVLGFYEGPLMVAVYVCLALPVFWHPWIQPLVDRCFPNSRDHGIGTVRRMAIELGLLNVGAFLAAVLFYLITSFVVWSGTPWYPSSFAGLSQAYWNAVPFLRWMIQGNLLFLNALAVAWLSYRAVAALPIKNAQPALPQ